MCNIPQKPFILVFTSRHSIDFVCCECWCASISQSSSVSCDINNNDFISVINCEGFLFAYKFRSRLCDQNSHFPIKINLCFVFFCLLFVCSHFYAIGRIKKERALFEENSLCAQRFNGFKSI